MITDFLQVLQAAAMHILQLLQYSCHPHTITCKAPAIFLQVQHARALDKTYPILKVPPAPELAMYWYRLLLIAKTRQCTVQI